MSGQTKMLDGCITGETGDSDTDDDANKGSANDDVSSDERTDAVYALNRVDTILHDAESHPTPSAAVNVVQESDYLTTTLVPQRLARGPPPSRQVLSVRANSSDKARQKEYMHSMTLTAPTTLESVDDVEGCLHNANDDGSGGGGGGGGGGDRVNTSANSDSDNDDASADDSVSKYDTARKYGAGNDAPEYASMAMWHPRASASGEEAHQSHSDDDDGNAEGAVAVVDSNNNNHDHSGATITLGGRSAAHEEDGDENNDNDDDEKVMKQMLADHNTWGVALATPMSSLLLERAKTRVDQHDDDGDDDGEVASSDCEASVYATVTDVNSSPQGNDSRRFLEARDRVAAAAARGSAMFWAERDAAIARGAAHAAAHTAAHAAARAQHAAAADGTRGRDAPKLETLRDAGAKQGNVEVDYMEPSVAGSSHASPRKLATHPTNQTMSTDSHTNEMAGKQMASSSSLLSSSTKPLMRPTALNALQDSLPTSLSEWSSDADYGDVGIGLDDMP
jgi:hypothetical protein